MRRIMSEKHCVLLLQIPIVNATNTLPLQGTVFPASLLNLKHDITAITWMNVKVTYWIICGGCRLHGHVVLLTVLL